MFVATFRLYVIVAAAAAYPGVIQGNVLRRHVIVMYALRLCVGHVDYYLDLFIDFVVDKGIRCAFLECVRFIFAQDTDRCGRHSRRWEVSWFRVFFVLVDSWGSRYRARAGGGLL